MSETVWFAKPESLNVTPGCHDVLHANGDRVFYWVDESGAVAEYLGVFDVRQLPNGKVTFNSVRAQCLGVAEREMALLNIHTALAGGLETRWPADE